MRAEKQPDDERIQQRYRWLMINGWADDLGSVEVVFRGKRYHPGLGMRDAYLRPVEKGEEEIIMPISEYYDLVMSWQIVHTEDQISS